MAYYIGSTYDRQSRRAVISQDIGQWNPSPALFLGDRQILLPAADSVDGGWTRESGSNVNLYQSIDELLPDNSDYIQSSILPVADATTIAIQSGLTPVAGQQYLKYTYGKSDAFVRIDLTVELLQSGSSIQTWTHTDVPVGFTEVAQLITATITDYTTLSLRWTGNQA